ncbi:hypothetical protein [Lactobacillus helveticus]|uniref:hypothetical protein n=1 Tax=Lactobacillus helveticus TaxID=1587 RepID=UPI0021A52ECE|nr:hypothetical protein [Lactobacillus helveticus]MCT3409499.1 hypothetical protein [Lactobacillus helveticus]
MKYVELKDGSVKYRISRDLLYIRLGIWDYTEITLDRQSFVNNNSNFDEFTQLFCQLLDGQRKKLSDFEDPYWGSLIDELIEGNLLIGYEEKAKSKVYVITDFQESHKIQKYSALCNQSVEVHSMDEPININDQFNYLVILNNLEVNRLKKINQTFFQNNKSWSMGIIDGKFMHLSTFEPHITGCFECFALGNSLRMADYENYISYLKEERNLRKANNSDSLSLFAYQLLLMLTMQNINSLKGQLLSIYIPKLEFNLEPLHKSALCNLDGLKAQEISEELNADAQNIIQKILEENKNEK